MINKVFESRTFYILASILAAAFLWLYVVGSVNPSQTRRLTFNIQYEGESVMANYNLRLASDARRTVTLHIEASSADMGRLEREPLMIVDVSGIRDPGEHDVTFTLTALNGLSGSVAYRPIGQSISNSDNTIIVRTNRVAGQAMPLVPSDIGYSIAETGEADYFFVGETASIEPAEIRIDGPEDILDLIHTVGVFGDFGEPLTETTTMQGTLRVYDEHGEPLPEYLLQDVEFSQDTVNVTVPVRMVREVPLQLNFEYGGGANEDNVLYQISRETVALIGDADVLRSLETIVLTRIRLDRVDMNETIPLYIPIPPMTELFDTGAIFEVGIQILNLEERIITVARDRVQFMGLAEDMRAVMETETFTITMRGPANILDELEDEDITIWVNLADYGSRTGRVRVESFTVQVEGHPPEIVGALDLPGQVITIHLSAA